ncbi:hypothetical protein [Mycolicibacterium smegmatis]|uniref:hypothetical protein n=1 Tax=Mycolicibacterium smegmatis TaxID=1772 RepID=UPI0013005971|nr:hypothetical protein [Mycolicibacterium smegmatis]
MHITRRWWILSFIVLVSASAIVAVLAVSKSGDQLNDCDKVRALLNFNRDHNKEIAEESTSADHEVDLSVYRDWADQVQKYATEIEDPDLSQHADQFAELARETVSIVQRAREETQSSQDMGVPSWVEDYSAVESKSRSELAALESRCPTAA